MHLYASCKKIVKYMPLSFVDHNLAVTKLIRSINSPLILHSFRRMNIDSTTLQTGEAIYNSS